MLRLTLFGEFSAAGADGIEFAIKSKKAKALLAYLALSPRMSRSREEIMALLWSDRGEAQARASLRQVLVGLRKDFGEESLAGMIVTNEAVALDPDKVTVEAAVAGEELLAGFHIHDPAFEDWLRDERLRHEDATVPGAQPPRLPLPDKPSIAVLPFVNMSGDAEQEYFSEGITEDIITELSRFRSLFVIARNSSFTYKGRSVRVQDVGGELGVQFVLEGSVRKSGNMVRVNAQLVDAMTGHHVWADRYDREVEEIFAVQDEITQTIVATLAGRLEEATREAAKRKSTESLAAYDYVLRGDEDLWLYTKERTARSRDMYSKALELDPRYARAYVGVACSYASDWGFLWGEDPDEDLNRAFEYAQKAVALDDTESRAHWVIAKVQVFRKEYAQARRHQQRAVALNPNDADALAEGSYVVSLLGDHQEAIELGEKAVRLNPYYPVWYLTFLGGNYYAAQRYGDAVAAFEGSSNSYPDDAAWLAASYAQLGQLDNARTVMAEFLELGGADPWWAQAPKSAAIIERDPTGLLRYIIYMYPYHNPSDLDHVLDGLRKAGLPE
jgi:adenylate cyclase